METNTIVLSIDLGTTNTTAYLFDGKDCISVEVDNSRIIPSCVWYHDDGSVSIGKSAEEGKRNIRNRVITNSKRLIGKKYDREEVQRVKEQCGVDVVNKNGKAMFHVKTEQKEKYVTPEKVASLIVERIIEKVKAYLSESQKEINKVLVTIPANFEHNQRVATRNAVYEVVREEGLSMNDITIINEPTAAAISYGLEQESKESRVLVYDFGGGTFDVSIMKLSNGKIDIIGHDGDPELGGISIDKLIADDLLKKYQEHYDKDLLEDVTEDKRTSFFRSLHDIACRAKIALSTAESTEVTISDIIHLKTDDECDFEYFREDMNKVIGIVFEKVEEVIERCLKKCNVTAEDIDDVILVGGSSRVVMARDMLKKMFGNKVKRDIDPDTCVAKGGCMYLISLNGESNIDIQERIAFSLGTELLDDRVKWIIPCDARIPCEYTECFKTTIDYQTSGNTHLIQGKSGENINEKISNQHLFLVPYSFTGFQVKKKGEVYFSITYSYQKNGIVHIKVVEDETGIILKDEDIQF